MGITYETVDQLSARTGISRWTLYLWVQRGDLPAIRFGRQLRFDPAEVDAALRRQRAVPMVSRESVAKTAPDGDGTGTAPLPEAVPVNGGARPAKAKRPTRAKRTKAVTRGAVK
jgi:excisionase family DNA binding protein